MEPGTDCQLTASN